MNELKQAPQAVDIDPPRREAFLDRWSRVKREVKAGAVPPGTVAAQAEATVLPSLETLAADIANKGLEADFTPFMQKGVEEATRRAAIQQLFKQPVFNVMDGLDVYIEDFNIYEPLLASELPGLAHARGLLFPDMEEEKGMQVQDGEAPQLATVVTEKQEQVEQQEQTSAEEQDHGRG